MQSRTCVSLSGVGCTPLTEQAASHWIRDLVHLEWRSRFPPQTKSVCSVVYKGTCCLDTGQRHPAYRSALRTAARGQGTDVTISVANLEANGAVATWPCWPLLIKGSVTASVCLAKVTVIRSSSFTQLYQMLHQSRDQTCIEC